MREWWGLYENEWYSRTAYNEGRNVEMGYLDDCDIPISVLFTSLVF